MDYLTTKSYCSQSDVERTQGFAAAATNVSQADILAAIIDASDKVDLIVHSRFHSTEDSGTAESGTTLTLTDTDKSWDVDAYENYVLWIKSGTGSGQYARIASNTSDTLTLESDDELTTAPGADSVYRIIPDVINSDTLDGSGVDKQYFHPYPIKSLEALEINSVTVTPAKVYKYEKKGLLLLNGNLNPEATSFSKVVPQDIVIKWVFGVYPIPRNILKLTANLAAMQCLIEQTGGTFDDVTSYTVPHFTASKGEPFTNIRETLLRLRNETVELKAKVQKYPATV
jgi:hypothetical protein